MTKVSTRPVKGATTVAEPATAVAVAPSKTDAQRVEDEGSVSQVAAAALELLNAAAPDFSKIEALNASAFTLLEIAGECLDQAAQSGDAECFYRAEALLAGALALDLAQYPKEVNRRSRLLNAFGLVEAAATSIGFAKGPCEDLAHGIRLGRLQDQVGERKTLPGYIPGQRVADVITRDTELPSAGLRGLELVYQAAAEIETVSDNLLEICGNDKDGAATGSLLRMCALRINTMNSLVLSYLGDDDITLNDAHIAVYGIGMKEGALQ